MCAENRGICGDRASALCQKRGKSGDKEEEGQPPKEVALEGATPDYESDGNSEGHLHSSGKEK